MVEGRYKIGKPYLSNLRIASFLFAYGVHTKSTLLLPVMCVSGDHLEAKSFC